jgi:hypothetical protein
MEKIDFYISLDLAKKLKEKWCEIESKFGFIINPKVTRETEQWYEEIDYNNSTPVFIQRENRTDAIQGKIIPTYHILEDICCRYAKEFFDNKLVISTDDNWWQYMTNPMVTHANRILNLMIWWKKQEAEDYISKNCVFK